MTKAEKRQKNRETRALLMRFLKGSKLLFCVSMLSAAFAALADMLSPQIIRAAIDNAIGGKEAEFPAWVMRQVDALGGFANQPETELIAAIYAEKGLDTLVKLWFVVVEEEREVHQVLFL